MTPRTIRSLPLIALCLTAAACNTVAPVADSSDLVPPLNIPAARAPRATNPELALLSPDVEAERDPFLTLREQRPEDVAQEVLVPQHTGPRGTRRPDDSVVQPPPIVASKLNRTSTIILGRRNTFEYEGVLYEEDEAIKGSSWVVSDITETGVRLRSKDGLTSNFVKFTREPQPIFEVAQK